MSLQKSPVRQLAWDYYLGKVDNHNEFRQKRELIINAMISGESMPAFEAGDPSEITEIPGLTKSSAEADAASIQVATTELPSEQKKSPLIPVTGVVIIGLIAVGSYFAFSNSDEVSPRPSIDVVQEQAIVLPESLQQTINSLNQGWSQSAADDFLAAWQTLPGDTQTELQKLPVISAVTEQAAAKAAELISMAGAGVSIVSADKKLINEMAAALRFPQPQWPAVNIETPARPLTIATSEELPSESMAATTAAVNLSQKALQDAVAAPIAAPMEPTKTVLDEFSKHTSAASSDAESLSSNVQITETKAAVTSKPGPSPSAPTANSPITPKPPLLTNPKTSSRPASIVMSEQEGCSHQMVNLRVRTCRDFLSRKVRAPRMVVMPSGNFIMGDSKRSVESPTIEVTIGSALAISSHEISFREFSIYCKNSASPCPTNSGGDRHQPVVGISWQEATNYTAWLSKRTGKQYRLPSEAEWEYAARAGSQTIYPFGDKLMVTQARFSERNRTATEPLSNTYQAVNPNAFQLYHMVGNVREWVADAWQDHHDNSVSDGSARNGNGQKVVRGGSFADTPEQLRSSARQPLDPSSKDRYTGFRVVLEFSATAS